MAHRVTRILIVDDHPIMRQGLITLLEGEEDLDVCGEAEDVPQALDAIEKLQPDFAIVDISLKGRSGMDLLKDLKQQHPKLQVLVLSMYDESLYAERALRYGARGYVMKQEAMDKVLAAIRRILAGEIYFSEKLSSATMRRLLDNASASSVSPLSQLSDREMEVFQRLGQGRSIREIAEELCLSAKTIETYREHLKAKLGLDSSGELLRYAIERATDLEGNTAQ
jgi:DNA-binding NarL/FixJ family response regulator